MVFKSNRTESQGYTVYVETFQSKSKVDVNDIHFEPKQPATAPRLVGSESRNFVSIQSHFEAK